MTYMRNISIIVPSSACLTARGPTILGNYLPLWSKKLQNGWDEAYTDEKPNKSPPNSNAKAPRARANKQDTKQPHPANPHRHS